MSGPAEETIAGLRRMADAGREMGWPEFAAKCEQSADELEAMLTAYRALPHCGAVSPDGVYRCVARRQPGDVHPAHVGIDANGASVIWRDEKPKRKRAAAAAQ